VRRFGECGDVTPLSFVSLFLLLLKTGGGKKGEKQKRRKKAALHRRTPNRLAAASIPAGSEAKPSRLIQY
jgi:hypothetical protein